MLILLSPAKKLLSVSKPYLGTTTVPIFKQKTHELVQLMKTKSEVELAKLMHLSKELAQLNYQRYQDFNSPNNPHYPAIFLFQGDVYRHLKAEFWDASTLDYAQSHLVILSGLYGMLRPIDRIQPYRLEMGTALANDCGKNLYTFWRDTLTLQLNTMMTAQKNPLIINLASTEYFDAINANCLTAPVLTINFREYKGEQFKIIGIQAKKARGLMADYLLRNRIEDPQDIKNFTALNYRFCEQSSTNNSFNFNRLSH